MAVASVQSRDSQLLGVPQPGQAELNTESHRALQFLSSFKPRSSSFGNPPLNFGVPGSGGGSSISEVRPTTGIGCTWRIWLVWELMLRFFHPQLVWGV